MRITYLFTTFPVLSETFLQREIRAMQALGVTLDIYSMHDGESDFENIPVKRFSKWMWLTLLWWLPFHLITSPRVLGKTLALYFKNKPTSLINVGENILGLAFALVHANHFKQSPSERIHAVWATAPATAAFLISRLNNIPFSTGAHAYDVFRHGGDWILDEKLNTASLVHTSTQATADELVRRGAAPECIKLIRRGLDTLPPFKEDSTSHTPMRLLAVGRLVEKKGYCEQIALYGYLKKNNFPFEAHIVGSGKFNKILQTQIDQLGLSDCVHLLGKREASEVFEQYTWADALLFTGKITNDGDRDGLPNILPEAMACGVPVVATSVSGVPEAITHEVTGLLVDLDNQDAWLHALIQLQEDDSLRQSIRTQARSWVEQHFCAHTNATKLLTALKQLRP